MSSSEPPDLRTCLEAASWRRLLAIMASHGLPASTRWHKTDLVDVLAAHLANPATLRPLLLDLSPAAQAALRALLPANGGLPVQSFSAAFGAIRPHQSWRRSAEAPASRQPWRDPASPAELLWYLGLLHLHPPKPAPGASQLVVLPADLLTILSELLLAPQAQQPLRLLLRPGRPADLAWHVALLLASLEAEPIRPLAGGWLPPRVLIGLAERAGFSLAALLTQPADEATAALPQPTTNYLPLAVQESEPVTGARSERRLPYLAMLHYLALAAGLIVGQQRFVLTVQGWRWLAAAPAERWRSLWQAWLAAPPALTTIFRFPWATVTPQGLTLVLAELSRLPLDAFTPLAQLVEQAHLRDSRNLLFQPYDQPRDVVAALVAGPLHWFGVVDLAESKDQPLVRLTLPGAWLLQLPDCGPPSFAPPQPCAARPADPDLVLVPPDVSPLHLARLAPLGDWLPAQPPAGVQALRLTAERIGLAVAGGLTLPQLYHILEEALGRPAGRRLRQRLRAWALAGQQVRIRRLTVLETADSALMGRLRSRKLVRRHLGEAISPTRSTVDPAGLPAVLQTLRNLELYAVAPPTAIQPAGNPQESQPGQPRQKPPGVPIDAGSAGLLYMAGLVYRGLGKHVPLHTPLSAEIMEDLSRHLSASQQEAAEYAARQVLDRIKAGLAGYLSLPAWQARSQQETILPIIEAAQAAGQDLALTYWSAGREQPVVRRVTPYWIEQREHILYLVAHCHLRGAERVFRLDRIITCAVV